MQAVRAVTAAFCLACVSAELVTQFLGADWARRCIKGVAGLYILVVLLQQVTGQVSVEIGDAASYAPVELGTAEQWITAQAEEQLADSLQTDIQQIWGVKLSLTIQLTQAGNEIQTDQVQVVPQSECSADVQQEIMDFLQQELGAVPIWKNEQAGT